MSAAGGGPGGTPPGDPDRAPAGAARGGSGGAAHAGAKATAPPRREPHTLLILLGLAALLALLLPWLPVGQFAPGQPVAMASYQAQAEPASVQVFSGGDGVGFVNLLFDGFTSGGRSSAAIGVIAFVLMVGGAFGVIQASGTIDRSLGRVVAATAGRPWLLLASVFTACSLGGAVFGMGEETIAFLALLLPLLDRLGYRREVGVMITYMASQIGFGSSWMNPFSVAVAQGIAGVPLLSGAPLRIAAWLTLTALGLLLMLRYAARTRLATVAPPAAAAAAGAGDGPGAAGPEGGNRIDAAMAPAPALALPGLAWPDRAILLAIAATLAWIVWGVVAGGYYIPQIASQFVALALVVGAIAVAAGRLRANDAAEAFVDGVRLLVPTALVIALAKGLVILLGGTDPHQPSVMNALLFGLAGGLQDTAPTLAAQGMLLAQSGFNLVVTSGSAQAAITMPLMAPLADLVGLSRQIAVLAFQFGDGLTNILTPASASLMGALGVAGLGWAGWLRVVWSIALAVWLAAAGFVALAVAIGYV
jgi:uncharacterized ion transporter superfamily protein YfcC